MSLSPHNNPPTSHTDTNQRLTTVYVYGTWGSCLCRVCPVQAHWAAAFEFQGDTEDGSYTVLIAELTAINGRGHMWNENNYSITDIRSVRGVRDLDGYASVKNYRKLLGCC